MNDWALLRDYLTQGDERAFTVLVERHIALVYHAAYRQIGRVDSAEEIAQEVFRELASKGGTLRTNGSLAGWLYRVACCKAIDFRRAESTRKRREQRLAEGMTEPHSTSDPDIPWSEIAPLLDEAMASLSEAHRSAVLMRVFERRSWADVGDTLGVSEEAVRKQVARALDQLRIWFERRGVDCTSAALSVSLGAFAAAPLASGFIHSTAQSALAHGVTTSIKSTFVTTFASMKISLALGLMAGATIPFSLGLGRFESVVQLPESRAINLTEASDGGRDFEQNEFLAEWKRLREEHGPAAGSMPAIYEAISSITDDFRQRVFLTALLNEWVGRDPFEALTYFQNVDDQVQIENVLTIWLKRDAKAAIAAMRSHGTHFPRVIGNLLNRVAQLSPSAVVDLAPLMEATNITYFHIREAFITGARIDLQSMVEGARSLDGELRLGALTGASEVWGEIDGASALAWAKELSLDEAQSKAIRAVLVGWAKADPTAALGQLLDDSITVDDQTKDYVFLTASQADLDTALEWLAVNPNAISERPVLGDSLTDSFLKDVPDTLSMIFSHPAAESLEWALSDILLNKGSSRRREVWEWLQSQPDSENIRRFKQELFRHEQDVDAMIEWFLEDQLSLERTPADLAKGLIVHRTGPESFENLLQRTPESLHIELLKAGFSEVQDEEVDQWILRLDDLPSDARPAAVGSLASVRARVDPRGAISWADTFERIERFEAYRGIAKTWAEADPYEASLWMADLPAGPARDHAASALVEVISKSEPDSAWVWAQSIMSPSQRLPALQVVLEQFGEKAIAMVNETTLADSEKADLLKWVRDQPEVLPKQ